jgi:hypothetical protein
VKSTHNSLEHIGDVSALLAHQKLLSPLIVIFLLDQFSMITGIVLLPSSYNSFIFPELFPLLFPKFPQLPKHTL